MPTQEFSDLVSAIEESIDQVLDTDLLMHSHTDQTTDAAPFGPGAPALAFVVDYEKIVWHYPDAPARLIEDTL